MNRKKLIALAVAAGAVLGIVAVIVVPRLIDPESYRGVLLAKAGAGLNGREVTLGPMSVKFWPGIGLEVKDIKIGGRDKDGPPLLTADGLVVRVAFFPLLSRRLEVKSIEIQSPVINLTRLGDGKWNVSDLAGGTETPEAGAEGKGEKSERSFNIKGVTITSGKLEIVDKSRPHGPSQGVILDRLELGDILADEPVRVRLAASLEGRPGRALVEGEIGPLAGDSAQAKFAADLNAEVDGLELSTITPWLDPGALPVELKSGALSGKAKIDAAAGQPIGVGLDASLTGVVYADPGKAWPASEPADVSLKARAVMNRGDDLLTIDHSSLTLPAGEVSISASIQNVSGGHPLISAVVKAPKLDLDKLLDILPMIAQPMTKAGVSATGPVSVFTTYDSNQDGTSKAVAELNLVDAAINVPGSFVKPPGTAALLGSAADVKAKAIELTNTNLKLGPLDFIGNGLIKRDGKLSTNIRMESGPADTAAAMSLFPSMSGYRLGGMIGMTLEAEGALKKMDSMVIRVERCELDSDDAKFSLAGLMRLTDPPQVVFQLDSQYLDLDKIIVADEGKDKGSADKKPDEKPDKKGADGSGPSGAPGIKADGKVSAARVIYQGMELKSLSASPKFSGGVLSIPDLAFRAYDTPIHGPVKLDMSGELLSGELGVNAEGAPVAKLMKQLTSFPAVVTGDAFGNASLKFKGTSDSAIRKNASGAGKIELRDGALRGVDLVNGLIEQWAGSDAVKSLARQSLGPALSRKIGDDTPFKKFSSAVTLAKGRISLDQAVMQVEDGEIRFDGSVGLDRTVKATGRLKLSKAVTESLMKAARRWVEMQSGGAVKGTMLDLLLEDGRLILPFKLSGAWPSPELTLDAGAYAKTVEKNLGNKTADKVIEQVVGEDKKKELDEQKQQAEKDIRKKAEDALGEDGKKILDGILPK